MKCLRICANTSVITCFFDSLPKKSPAILTRDVTSRPPQLTNNGTRESEEADRLTADDVPDEEVDIGGVDLDDGSFLHPYPSKHRHSLLKAAGVKKVDKEEKRQLHQIRLSREDCGCDCQGFCEPETCACSLAGIKCQVECAGGPLRTGMHKGVVRVRVMRRYLSSSSWKRGRKAPLSKFVTLLSATVRYSDICFTLQSVFSIRFCIDNLFSALVGGHFQCALEIKVTRIFQYKPFLRLYIKMALIVN